MAELTVKNSDCFQTELQAVIPQESSSSIPFVFGKEIDMTVRFDPLIRQGLLSAAWLISMLGVLPLGAQTMQRKVPAPAAAPTQVVQPGPSVKPPSPNVGGVAALNSGAIAAGQAVPASVPFGRLFSGDHRQVEVKVVAPREGRVTVAVTPNSPFTLAEVKVLGLPVGPSMRPVPNQAAKPTTGSQRMAAPGSGAAPAMVFNVSKTLLATFTSAPFSIPVREGNELVVTLVFAPKLDLVNGPYVGDHQATLTLDGGLWKTSVPISGRFEGLKIGMIAVMSNPDVVAYSGKLGALSGAELVLTNAEKQPVVAQITAKILPAGFAMAQVNVQVPGGQTSTVPLPIRISPAMQEGAQQTAELTVAYSGKTKTVPFTFSVYPPMKQFRFEGEDGVKWAFWIVIHPSGNTDFGMNVTNPNFLMNRKVVFDVKWKGIHLYSAVIDVGTRAQSGPNGYDQFTHWTIPIALVRDHYVEMLQVPPTVTMTYENH